MIDYKKSYVAFRAAGVFDLQHVKELCKAEVKALVQDLALFEFIDFTPTFIKKVNSEIDLFMRKVGDDFDWDTLPGAKEYNAKIAKKRRKNPPGDEFEEEDDDVDELAGYRAVEV